MAAKTLTMTGNIQKTRDLATKAKVLGCHCCCALGNKSEEVTSQRGQHLLGGGGQTQEVGGKLSKGLVKPCSARILLLPFSKAAKYIFRCRMEFILS